MKEIYVVERRTGLHTWTIDSAWIGEKNASIRVVEISRMQRKKGSAGGAYIGASKHLVRVADAQSDSLADQPAGITGAKFVKKMEKMRSEMSEEARCADET